MRGSGPDLLLVRGAPGVGKSTAVTRLRRTGAVGAIVEVDALRGMIAGVEWTNKHQHMLALDHARLVAESFLGRGYRPTVIVDTLGRARLEAWVPSLSVSYRIVSFYASPEVLTARIAGRPEGQFKDLGPCLVLNEEISSHRYAHERMVDTTELSPEDAARVLLEELSGCEV